MALIEIPANTVTKIADTANNFRAENLSPQSIKVFYADSAPSAPTGIDDAWGTLPSGSVEIRIVDGNLYGYSTKKSYVSVFESPIPD